MAVTSERAVALRAINAVGGAVGRLGLRPNLDPEALIAAAVKATGFDDFGGDAWREGYEVLLHSLEDEGELTTIGRVAARTRMLDLLSTRLRLIDHRKRHPEVADEVIDRPIFVLGLPRTGTTVLYGLLASNPAMRSPVSWEVARPFPPPTQAERAADPRIAATQKEFDQFEKIAPGIFAIHPLGAELPQECLALQAPEFASYMFPSSFEAPAYWEWLRGQDLRGAYEFQKLFMQHLQSGYGGEHWILKTPGHLMWLDTLLDVFPDALIVQTHRDPTTVIASVSSLMFAMRSAMSDAVDPHTIGREQFAAWQWGLARTIEARERLPDARVVDVHFRDTLADPVGTVRRVYEHFGIEVTPDIDAGVRAYLEANPRTKHGTHTYTLEDFGLDEAEVSAAFADYRERFGVDAG